MPSSLPTWTWWDCGSCGQPWFRCGCDDPQPTNLSEQAGSGRGDRSVGVLVDRANRGELSVGDLLRSEALWRWLAHSPGAAELRHGPIIWPTPRHTIWLSGVECQFTRQYAHRHDLGILVQPGTTSYVARLGAYGRWAADNGCYSQGARFDVAAWRRWVATLPAGGCLFAVAPDVFDPAAGRGDPHATWARSAPEFELIRSCGLPAALVAQDGVEDMDLDWDAFDVLFLGGSTEWKMSAAAADVAAEARRFGLWTHMGRVNSARRLRHATLVGVDSADGTYLAFGPDTNGPKVLGWLDQLDAADTQPTLFEAVA